MGLLAVVGGAGFYVMSMGSMEPQAVTESDVSKVANKDENTPADEPVAITGKDSILALEAMGKDLQCDFVVGEGDSRSEGTGFFSKGNVRVDTVIKGKNPNSPDAAYMIMNKDDDAMYTWTVVAGTAQGVKMSIKEISAMGSSTAGKNPVTQNKEQVRPETPVNYNCKPWRVDASVFVPPTEVTFMDMSNMDAMRDAAMKGMMPTKVQ